MILNSLAEEKLQASVRLLAQHGRFLEIGKFDLANNSSLGMFTFLLQSLHSKFADLCSNLCIPGMAVFLKNVSFHGILLDSLFDPGNSDWETVRQLFEEGLQSGVVIPLNHTCFDKYDVEEAFRFMASGKHIGKVLIEV